MSAYADSVQDLIDAFGRLPGIGPKSAQRIAFHLLKSEPEESRNLAQAITAGPEMSSVVRFLLILLAVVLSAAGPLYVVITAIRSLADETCLVLRSDGVHYLSKEGSFFVRWRDVVASAYDEEEDALRIQTETTELLIRHPHFVGVKSRQLAERLDDVRRRALLGLIRPADVWGWEENRTPNRH